MAYDASDGYVVLFGGGNGNYCGGPPAEMHDTWTFKAGVWTPLDLGNYPTAREGAYMSYDPEEGEIILFGGANSTGAEYSDTWAFKGGSWFQLHPTTSPSARGYGDMVYNSSLGELVLFGGSSGSGPGDTHNDVWTFANGNWTNVTSASGTAPAVRWGSSFWYDSSTGTTWMFGGADTETGPYIYSDTWRLALGSGGMPNSLIGVSVTPSSDEVGLGESVTFTASPTCSTGSCPAGTTYSWDLSTTGLGSLGSSFGSSTTFTAGTTSGLVDLFVNATLNGDTVMSAAVPITISAAVPVLQTVEVSPASASLSAGGAQSFTASTTCSTLCPGSISYAWALSNNLGVLSTARGDSTTFTAGSALGSVTLRLTATLGVATKFANATITVSAPPTTSASTEDYIVVGTVLAVVSTVLVIFVLRQRKQPRLGPTLQTSPPPTPQGPPPPPRAPP